MKKNILVYDVAATESGALSVLKSFIKDLSCDNYNNWYILVSTNKISSSQDNVHIIRNEKLKKINFRLIFEKRIIRKIVKSNKIDFILNLQNMPVTNKNNEIVFVQNIIPFVDYKFSITKDTKLWIYKNIYGKILLKRIKQHSIIVQTKWLKNYLLGFTKTSVCMIDTTIDEKYFLTEKEVNNSIKKAFFYPAILESYKNHVLIFEAIKKMLNAKNDIDFKIYLTINEKEFDSVYEQYRSIKPVIEFLGKISIEKMIYYYDNCVLIYPSLLESLGLPLLEAMSRNSLILCSNIELLSEVLDGYDNVEFFDPHKVDELIFLMSNCSFTKSNEIQKKAIQNNLVLVFKEMINKNDDIE